MTELEGIPLSLVVCDLEERRTIGITLDVGGTIHVASAGSSGMGAHSLQATEMLSMVAAAVERKVPIRVRGWVNDAAAPETTYPRGSFRIQEIEAFGYKWGVNYLER